MSVSNQFIPFSEFQRIRTARVDKHVCLQLIADMCRLNTLAIVKRAGSGHLGSSLSAMDLVSWLYYEQLNTTSLGFDHPDRDIYFSSKGHDVPGLYALLYALGVLPQERLLKLRRLGGLDGHPDVNIPGIEANSGSLGMGISKGRGMAWAKRHKKLGGKVYVLIGDGELQEGQNYEALHAAVQQRIDNLIVIVDHNKLQSDKTVEEIMGLGVLEEKFRAFGWYVGRCDGHDYAQIERVFSEATQVKDRPQIIIADTIKGRGVSFMEHPIALKEGKGFYRWHAGAPPDEPFAQAQRELIERLQLTLKKLGLEPFTVEDVSEKEVILSQSLIGEPVSAGAQKTLRGSTEYVADAYGQALVELAAQRPDIVVLDGDLAADCRVRAFELTYPERFIENGIAEQDMVSMAGGLARQGLLPVVNSFANFLAARANEQIYNNATERSKIIYACHYAGLIPAGPGKSHQSIRDISLFTALPNCIVVQPCNAQETRLALQYGVDQSKDNYVMRLAIGPSPRVIELPKDYVFQMGQGTTLREGKDGILFSYGPVMLHEALLAAELLAQENFSLQVVNLPWLNRIDPTWLTKTLEHHRQVFVLEDHAPIGGLGDSLVRTMVRLRATREIQTLVFGVEGYPTCGTPAEALRAHRLDGASLRARILDAST